MKKLHAAWEWYWSGWREHPWRSTANSLVGVGLGIWVTVAPSWQTWAMVAVVCLLSPLAIAAAAEFLSDEFRVGR